VAAASSRGCVCSGCPQRGCRWVVTGSTRVNSYLSYNTGSSEVSVMHLQGLCLRSKCRWGGVAFGV
jgi:hypothetical protein